MTLQYSGEGVKLLSSRGGSMQLGTSIAYARYIIEQTLAVCNFLRNCLFKKKFCRSAWMEDLYKILKYFLPAAIPLKSNMTSMFVLDQEEVPTGGRSRITKRSRVGVLQRKRIRN